MSIRAATTRARTLRLVRPNERAAPRAGTEVRTRRSVALLLGSTAFLVATGLVMVLSASSVSAFAEYGDSFVFVQRQAAYAVVGVLAMIVTSRMPYRAWRRLAGPFLVLTIAMLVLVLMPSAGIEAYGASRWFRIGPVTVQPSEIAKLALVVFLAFQIERHKDRVGSRELLVPVGVATGLAAGLVVLEPDLGSAHRDREELAPLITPSEAAAIGAR